VNREIKFIGLVNQTIVVLFHLFSMPGSNCSFIYRESGIGEDQILIKSDNISISFTFRTSTRGIIKAEKMFIGFEKFHSIPFKFIVESLTAVIAEFLDIYFPLSFVKSFLYGVSQPIIEIFAVFFYYSVNDQNKGVFSQLFGICFI